MPSPRRDRDRRPGRRPPFREPLPIILIVCEGKKTEPEYFRGFVNACQNPRVKIEIAPEHGVPRTLVESARGPKKEAETAASRQGDETVYDSVWCVFDVDDHPHIASARQMGATMASNWRSRIRASSCGCSFISGKAPGYSLGHSPEHASVSCPRI